MEETQSDLLTKAIVFAEAAHGTQRYGQYPYSHHLASVSGVLRRFDHNTETLMCAAWLHDVLEDTPTNYADVLKAFGLEVAELVYAVTDELGRNRNERHNKTYPKVRALPQAVVLKLADRIANVEHSIEIMDSGKMAMYQKEQELFYLGIGIDEAPAAAPMWKHLEELLNTHL